MKNMYNCQQESMSITPTIVAHEEHENKKQNTYNCA